MGRAKVAASEVLNQGLGMAVGGRLLGQAANHFRLGPHWRLTLISLRTDCKRPMKAARSLQGFCYNQPPVAGHITYFNPAAERIFGDSSAEASGQPLTLLMPERDFCRTHSYGHPGRGLGSTITPMLRRSALLLANIGSVGYVTGTGNIYCGVTYEICKIHRRIW